MKCNLENVAKSKTNKQSRDILRANSVTSAAGSTVTVDCADFRISASW